jgi:hypothetical protein
LKTNAHKKHHIQTYLETCLKFEQKYGISSDEFLLKFESGELGDSQDFFDWFAAKRGLEFQITLSAPPTPPSTS